MSEFKLFSWTNLIGITTDGISSMLKKTAGFFNKRHWDKKPMDYSCLLMQKMEPFSWESSAFTKLKKRAKFEIGWI